MDRLDQLVARSQREIEAHTHELGDTDSGRYFITEASHLLAALRLWAQRMGPDLLQLTGHVVKRDDVASLFRRADDHRFLRSASLVTTAGRSATGMTWNRRSAGDCKP
jgi:hypothetical protein